jgi:hypothetical protein
MDRDVHLDPYHVAVVRGLLTRHLGICFPDIYDEVVAAFSDLIPVTDGKLRFYHHDLVLKARRVD